MSLTDEERDTLLGLAATWIEVGRPDDACTILCGIADLEPDDDAPHRLLAEAFAKNERWEEALRALGTALEKRDVVATRRRRAEIWIERGFYANAVSDLDAILQTRDDPRAKLLRARLHRPLR